MMSPSQPSSRLRSSIKDAVWYQIAVSELLNLSSTFSDIKVLVKPTTQFEKIFKSAYVGSVLEPSSIC